MLAIAWLGACSGNPNDAETSGTGQIGRVCSADTDCLGGTMCAAAGVCTKGCGLHSDCGCLANTTNQDITSGACEVACVKYTCARVCETSLECPGSTDCQATDSGFSVCL